MLIIFHQRPNYNLKIQSAAKYALPCLLSLLLFDQRSFSETTKSSYCDVVHVETLLSEKSTQSIKEALEGNSIRVDALEKSAEVIEQKSAEILATPAAQIVSSNKWTVRIKDWIIEYHKKNRTRYGSLYSAVIIGAGLTTEILIPIFPGTFLIGSSGAIGLAEAVLAVRKLFKLGEMGDTDGDEKPPQSSEQMISDIIRFQRELIDFILKEQPLADASEDLNR